MTRPSTTRRLPIDGFELAHREIGLAPTDLADRDQAWVPAVVPGGVHESLLALGTIPDPYVDRNEEAVRWMEERDWWYRTTFDSPPDLQPGDGTRLVFHGLDTVADVWLNGELLGHHENMFRPAEYEIAELLRPSNDLLIRFSPPLAGLSASPASVAQLQRVAATLMPDLGADVDVSGLSPDLTVATQRRKATMSWGWDFGPRVPSIGIWRPVEMIITPCARITGHHVRTDAIDHDAETAELTVLVEVETGPAAGTLHASIELTSATGRSHQITIPVRDGVAEGHITVDDAELWWTHDLGDPSLYQVRIELGSDEGPCDVVTDRIGIRTIAVNRAPDAEGGRLFQFVLNDVPVFARGANWLPASMLVGSVTPERHRELISLAREGGMTMLRVWGGGVYEHDGFYTAADEAGVLIWQDFMFACADYPSEDAGLQREVQLEAEYQLRRLRNRASLALWSGNNEVHLLHGFAYQEYEPGNWGWHFFHKILPETVRRLDPTATYWPGSPWGEDTPEGFMAVNGVLDGDRHAWEVWHGFDAGAGGGEEYASVGEARHFRRYARDRGRFISEFGIHSSPALSTLQRWLPAAELAIHSPSFDAHNKDHPKDKGDALLEVVTGVPTTIEEYVDFTMASQAEGMKFGIEHYRRRQPICSGTLVWQFNDVWPGITWSLVDYDTVPKAAYYATARAYAPVLASFLHHDGELSLWVSNSGRTPVSTTATLSVRGFDGSRLLQEHVPVRIAAATSERVWAAPLNGSTQTYAWVGSEDGTFPDNRLFFADVKDLPLPDAELRSTVRVTGSTSAEVRIEADQFAYLVRVTSTHPAARFSDNYFDLTPGQTRTVRVTDLPRDFDPADVTAASYVGAGR